MVKLFFSALTGYAIFVGLMMFQIITPLVNGIDAQLGARALRVAVPDGAPIPGVLAQFIDEHPQLVLRLCEGSVLVLLGWSTILLVTHWIRGICAAWRTYNGNRAMIASHQLAAMAAKKRDSWG